MSAGLAEGTGLEGAGADGGRPRVLVLTDTDSYVKYGAALAGRLPKDWEARLVVARSGAIPSSRQLSAALEGTRFEDEQVEVVDHVQLRGLLRAWSPDVVLLAARGYCVQAAVSLITNDAHRPVLVSGLAGIAYPVLPFGLGFRRSVDVFVVHSHRELREFERVSRRLGLAHGFELGTMPFVDQASAPATSDVMHAGPDDSLREGPVRDRIVFAAQAQVPGTRRERDRVVQRLVETARAHPHLRVVVKVRARAGEAQTHHEQVPYEQLLAERDDVPANLVVEGGSMRAQLRHAVGFVTVSSTALLEALAAGVPSLALDDFGVGAAQINLVLEDSGLLAPSGELVAGRFAKPDPDWLADNYFHDPRDDTWVERVEELVAQRESIGLLPYREPPGGWANRPRRLLYRYVAFRPQEPGLRDHAERIVLIVATWLNRRRWQLTRWFAS